MTNSPSSTNREKFEKIERSDRRQKKNRLWSDFSLIEIKKKHKKTVTDQTATCFPSWEIWLVNLKYTWSCCHCLQVSTYLKSLVSLIYCRPEPFQVKMLRNSAYTKEKNCQDNCPSRLSRRLIHTMKKSIHKVSDGQISIRFPCFLAERTWEKAWYFTTFFHGRCLHRCFNFSFT